MSRNVIVTGGAGFIGSHVCKALNQSSFYPIVIDDLSTGHKEFVKWGHLENFSIQDQRRLLQVFNDTNPTAVIHLAASAYVGESIENPALYYENNVIGMYSLLSTIKAFGTCPIIFSSSCATYGQPTVQPISEDVHQNPVNVYGRTKLICEWMLEDFSTAYDIPFISLRYFNVAGADPDGDLFEKHDPETHLIPRAIIATYDERTQFEIFGDNYPTKDGTCVRDYIHVSDLAEAHVAAANKLLADRRNDCYNLGTGTGFSILEIINQIEKETGKPVKYRFSKNRDGDPPILIANSKKAKLELGFNPYRSTLDTIIKTAVSTFSKDCKNEL